LERAVTDIIKCFDDPAREGLQDTPRRYARFMQEFMRVREFNMTTFDNEGYNEMIVQRGIKFYSLCEHHLLPFFGTATIAYLPDKRIIGLSKFARVLQHFAQQFQNQERITNQVADYFMEKLQPRGVGVIITAEHFCMTMRGVRQHGAETRTTALRGVFLNAEPRNEFLSSHE
jgi:GTP cyclohydrolase I